MPRILRRSIYVTPLLVLLSLPGGQNSLWNSLRPTVSAAIFFTVNSTGDGADSNLGDGVCNDGTGACTLRAAIQEANTIPGDDTITFAITLNGSVITLNSALPGIGGNLNISGPSSSLLTVQRSTIGSTPDFRIFTINSGAVVTITGLTISNGRAFGFPSPANLGGGILNSGTLTLNLSAVSGNSASEGGGGIHNLDTLTVNSSVISGNAGGISNNPHEGPSTPPHEATSTATINHSVISGNTKSGISNNAIDGTANLTINNSTISGNTTDNIAGGGGIFLGAGSFTSRSKLTINNSTISGNHASDGQGGGIYSAAVFGDAETTLTVTNSTITGNTCRSGCSGGGILHFSSGSGSKAVATVTNSTIVNNSAGRGGGIRTEAGSSITTFSLRNTIVANNAGSSNAPELSGDFDSQDYNLIENPLGATFTGTTTHNITGQDPALGPLADYGGPTKTMIPLPHSPVIDAGDVANLPSDTTDADGDGNTSELLPVDQRGFPRVVNNRFDIGAVETNYSITASNADFFVRQHYHDFLNREAANDPDGLAFWTNQITECQQPDATCDAELRRINVSAAFFLSIEFQETGYLVYRMYKAGYGNITGTPVPVRFNEFLPDKQQIGQGVVVGIGNWRTMLDNNKLAFAQDFVSRLRFTTAYPTTLTPAQFVDALFINEGVTPSAPDRDTAIDEFGGAGNTVDAAARARALRRVAENSTFTQQEFNRAFVLMQYFAYLRRNPNDAPEPGLNFDGYNFWFNKLNQFNGDYISAEMVKAFITSGEYRQRFGL